MLCSFHSQILELDLGSLTAGCMMPGEFEERLKAVLNEVGFELPKGGEVCRVLDAQA
jgi:hypothetical protein